LPLKSRTRLGLARMARIAVISAFAAAGFNGVTVGWSFGSAAQGVIDGLLATLTIGGYLIILREGPLREPLRQLASTPSSCSRCSSSPVHSASS